MENLNYIVDLTMGYVALGAFFLVILFLLALVGHFLLEFFRWGW